MIGAMPAVAVRHERRKQEKRTKRPSQLYLGSYGLKHPSPPSRGSSPTPSPLQSPPSHYDDPPSEYYVCGKVSVLHIVVVSLLLGAILLIVGLVQLKPGADASDHRYYLIATGCFLMVLGLILTGVRCWVLPRRQRKARRAQRMRKEDSQVVELAPPDPEHPLDVVMVNEGAETATVSSADLVPRVSVSSSGDGLQSTMLTSPSEHDVLIKESHSTNLEQTCADT
ncbi:uncharacterized protein [Anabrus simplex]|uniref:uncharacterized protein n=1 Tax=Anabrus simplex TaxID=316456 RepID=UPI0034DDBF50